MNPPVLGQSCGSERTRFLEWTIIATLFWKIIEDIPKKEER